MTNINVRKWLVDQLKPGLPRGWRFVPYGTNLDTLSQPVVMVFLESIRRDPDAPLSHRIASFTLRLLEPKLDPATREDALDDNVIDLLAAVDNNDHIAWESAQRVLASDVLAYDITLTTKFKKLEA